MVIDGKKIATEILSEIKKNVLELERTPRLKVFTSTPNFETKKFLSIKKRQADKIGVGLVLVEFPENVTTEDVVQSIQKGAEDSDGIIVQLPFPKHIDRQSIISAVPASHDVDGFTEDNKAILSPVVGAMKEVLAECEVSIKGKQVVVVGDGQLVGIPVAKWFKENGAGVVVITKETADAKMHTREADIIALGAGVPNILTPDMIKEGVVILDAGTSEESGELRGDADPACAEKASIFTPVPGGIGPITVAILLRNLVTLASQR